MLRFLVSFFLTIFCFVLQSTVFPAISFGGIVPNLMIVLTASFGFMRGEKSGLLFGFFCGLLADIFFGSFIGLYALIYMYIGYLNGQFHHIYTIVVTLLLYPLILWINKRLESREQRSARKFV